VLEDQWSVENWVATQRGIGLSEPPSQARSTGLMKTPSGRCGGVGARVRRAASRVRPALGGGGGGGGGGPPPPPPAWGSRRPALGRLSAGPCGVPRGSASSTRSNLSQCNHNTKVLLTFKTPKSCRTTLEYSGEARISATELSRNGVCARVMASARCLCWQAYYAFGFLARPLLRLLFREYAGQPYGAQKRRGGSCTYVGTLAVTGPDAGLSFPDGEGGHTTVHQPPSNGSDCVPRALHAIGTTPVGGGAVDFDGADAHTSADAGRGAGGGGVMDGSAGDDRGAASDARADFGRGAGGGVNAGVRQGCGAPLGRLRAPQPLVRELRLHMDACAGTNKPQCFMGGLGLLLSSGVLDCSMLLFAVVGHIRFGPDLVARQVAGMYNRSNAFNHRQLIDHRRPYCSLSLYYWGIWPGSPPDWSEFKWRIELICGSPFWRSLPSCISVLSFIVSTLVVFRSL